jgi:hypothetical protein
MAPVEQSSVPSYNVSRSALSELKMVEKAMELPVVQDTIHGLEIVRATISDNAQLKSATHMVEDGIKSATHLVEGGIKAISVNPAVQGVQEGVKYIQDSKAVHQTVQNVNEMMRPHVDSLLQRVPGAVEKLDSYACGGIDSLTSAIPALSTPTPQLLESTKEAGWEYVSIFKEYVSSFTAAQISLTVADKSLSLAEKSVSFFKPDKPDAGVLCRTYGKIRSVRRSLRALRRAGSRRNTMRRTPLARAGLVGQVANMLAVNCVLKMAGLELVPAKKTDKPGKGVEVVEEVQGKEATIHDLHKDMSGYRSDQDPDYQAPDLNSSLDTDHTLDSDEQSEDDEEYEEDEDEADRQKFEEELDSSNPFRDELHPGDQVVFQGVQHSAQKSAPKKL